MNKRVVLVIPTNTIGVIIDEGVNPNGSKWYRTDCDGVREEDELAFIQDGELSDLYNYSKYKKQIKQ